MKTTVALSLLMLGCGREPSTAPTVATVSSATVRDSAPSTELRLLAMGDSFTIGTGSSPAQAFPARLAEHWSRSGCPVALENVAVNGYSSEDVLEREVPLIATAKPTWITLALGANDIVRRLGREGFRSRVATILGKAVAMVTPKHVLVIPQPRWPSSPTGMEFGPTLQDEVDAFDAILREESVKAGARWIDLSALMIRQANEGMLARDGLHPSAKAHQEWADAIAKQVSCRD